MRDLLIGAVTKLTWQQCLPWVNSINRSGFEGEKAVVIFGEDLELANNFQQAGFNPILVRPLHEQENICVARFLIYYSYLYANPNKYRFVLATDVTDVIFQKNPSEFLSSLIEVEGDQMIVLSGENIRYQDEAWGANNLQLSFGPLAFDRLKNNQIYNCGVVAGTQSLAMDLFLNIFLICEARQQHVLGGGGPDQAALNYLTTLQPLSSHCIKLHHDRGWACQVGTTADPNKVYDAKNIVENPVLNDQTVETSDGNPYYIVHQYNRNILWKAVLEDKYGQ